MDFSLPPAADGTQSAPLKAPLDALSYLTLLKLRAATGGRLLPVRRRHPAHRRRQTGEAAPGPGDVSGEPSRHQKSHPVFRPGRPRHGGRSRRWRSPGGPAKVVENFPPPGRFQRFFTAEKRDRLPGRDPWRRCEMIFYREVPRGSSCLAAVPASIAFGRPNAAC